MYLSCACQLKYSIFRIFYLPSWTYIQYECLLLISAYFQEDNMVILSQGATCQIVSQSFPFTTGRGRERKKGDSGLAPPTLPFPA